jgi:hypothetical protein
MAEVQGLSQGMAGGYARGGAGGVGGWGGGNRVQVSQHSALHEWFKVGLDVVFLCACVCGVLLVCV